MNHVFRTAVSRVVLAAAVVGAGPLLAGCSKPLTKEIALDQLKERSLGALRCQWKGNIESEGTGAKRVLKATGYEYSLSASEKACRKALQEQGLLSWGPCADPSDASCNVEGRTFTLGEHNAEVDKLERFYFDCGSYRVDSIVDVATKKDGATAKYVAKPSPDHALLDAVGNCTLDVPDEPTSGSAAFSMVEGEQGKSWKVVEK